MEFFTVNEIAERLKVHPATVKRWLREGRLGGVPLGDRAGWRVRMDPADTGAAQGWARGGFGGRPVSVPYVPNATALTSRSFAGSVAWYERDLQVRRAGRYVLRFESVNHRATVWLVFYCRPA